MKYIETKFVSLDDIDLGSSWRAQKPEWVDALASKIAKNGQKTPIELVTQTNGDKPYRLVAGRHRVAAIRQNGGSEIRADIFAPEAKHASLFIELAELDENLDRHELDHLDRATFIGRREEIYVQLYPETVQGKAGANARHGHANEKLSFAQETAEMIGLGVRAVQRATRMYKSISPEIRKRLQGTEFANKEGELYQLTYRSEEEQSKILDMCLREDDPVISIRIAGDILDGVARKPKSVADQQYEKLYDTWKRCDNKPARKKFLNDLIEMGVIPSFDEGQL